ncbi:hypothetical protein PHLCEN_2v1954 [Hermanssonia centrifuga]|uniref:Prolyl 4-hydroxylase alpha subunit Fe(2+) 2OG dioxygenase domain-containing protein n=1 Tax=Hermanssonia centrifuga TaxID=98765 RepID=A0A2R6RVE2_9APHY|nr:hypothetical protein PHLCEN_2v1954 [Hermanssonia centrifuga]
MPWYTDVMHEIKPITSGYRLALSYNLIHSTKSLRPALSGKLGMMGELRKVLVAWKEDGGELSPEKILFLLDHKYSQANLRASALKGADGQRVALLDALAKDYGFCLGLASVVCHLSGCPDDDGGDRQRRGGYGWGSNDEGGSDYDERLSFAEVSDRDMAIENFVDLEGEPISETLLDVNEEEEMIPANLSMVLMTTRNTKGIWEM